MTLSKKGSFGKRLSKIDSELLKRGSFCTSNSRNKGQWVRVKELSCDARCFAMFLITESYAFGRLCLMSLQGLKLAKNFKGHLGLWC